MDTQERVQAGDRLDGAVQLMTAEQFAELSIDQYSEHYRFELADGCLQVHEPAQPYHGSSMTQITLLLGSFIRDRRLGKLYTGDTNYFIKRNPDTVRGPDLAFVGADRLGTVDRRWLTRADLVVEVLSASNTPGLMAAKLANYLLVGTRLIWYVDAEKRRVSVHRLDGSTTILGADDVLSGEDVLPGFECRVREFFD